MGTCWLASPFAEKDLAVEWIKKSMPCCCEKGKQPPGTYKRRQDAVDNPLLGMNAAGYRVSRKVRADGETPVGSREQPQVRLCGRTTGTMHAQSGEEMAVGTHDNRFQIHKRLPCTGREYISFTHGD